MTAKEDTRKRDANRIAVLTAWWKKNKNKTTVKLEGKFARTVFDGKPKKVHDVAATADGVPKRVQWPEQI